VVDSWVNEIVDDVAGTLRGRHVLVKTVEPASGCAKEINPHALGLWEAGSANEVVVEESGCHDGLDCL
jgi:hypothetical protein